jgi:hypothetical protein
VVSHSLVEILVNKGVEVDKEHSDAKTASMFASEASESKEKGCRQSLKLVLERDEDANAEAQSEQTAMADATGAEDMKVMESLLQQGEKE